MKSILVTLVMVLLVLNVLFAAGSAEYNEDKIRPFISDYLLERISSSGFGGQVFCSYKIIGSERKNGFTRLYLWVHCQEYYGPSVKEGTEVSLPVMLEFKAVVNDIVITRFKTASTDFRNNIKSIFPQELLPKIFPGLNDYTIYDGMISELKKTNYIKAKDFFKNCR